LKDVVPFTTLERSKVNKKYMQIHYYADRPVKRGKRILKKKRQAVVYKLDRNGDLIGKFIGEIFKIF
jgi:hypothetical protein